MQTLLLHSCIKARAFSARVCAFCSSFEFPVLGRGKGKSFTVVSLRSGDTMSDGREPNNDGSSLALVGLGLPQPLPEAEAQPPRSRSATPAPLPQPNLAFLHCPCQVCKKVIPQKPGLSLGCCSGFLNSRSEMVRDSIKTNLPLGFGIKSTYFFHRQGNCNFALRTCPTRLLCCSRLPKCQIPTTQTEHSRKSFWEWSELSRKSF